MRNPVQSVNSGIGPFSSRVLNLNHLIHTKSENLQWKKCRYIKGRKITFSDTAQHFHLKHLKNLPTCHEKHFFFNRMVFQGQKDIFQNWLRAAHLCQLNQTMLDQKGKCFFIKTYFIPVFTGKAFKHCMFELRLQIGFYDQNLVRKRGLWNQIWFILTKYILKIMETQVYYKTIWLNTFVEHIFVLLCKVQGV